MAIRCERPVPHVELVTIDRPEKANALDPASLRELAAAWRRIAADDEVRCVVITGAGERAFCAGMDLATTIPAAQRLARGERIDPDDFAGLRDAATAVLAGFDPGRPLVAAVNGHCRAAGLDLLLQCDLRYAAPHATFGLEEVARGLYPTGNATVLLPRQIAWVHAMELLLTARPIAAAIIAGNAPLAVRATRRGVRELLSLPLDEAWRRQEELGRPLRRTEDAAEGARAFLERRTPVWKGR